ncbi:uncharacterized protein DUF4126 [Stackebrandtia albiflava]|uniref:Uncharacterized protein DUF4126 n=1 Tax=Stackebrandtia albiflava TaxID=406432 RepID=A0A562VBS1_9ACTN|nr:DUF4126 domain-containing protein [Stackebrandtia albiflava]TWJ15302.1 uncharacterized protein DUF4126 [Stackebrandtia albiflava]
MLAYLTAAGLSASAGLNAYIPLLVVGLLSRFTDSVSLPAGFDWLASWWALSVMTVLLVVEFVVDKVPVLDHVNDVIQTVIRPASGGAVAAATTAAGEWDAAANAAMESQHPALAAAGGTAIALAVHGLKALLRPMLNAGSGGVAAPVASTAEDAGSVGMSLLSVFAPVLAGVALLILVLVGWRLWLARRRWRRRRAERRSAKAARRDAPDATLPG